MVSPVTGLPAFPLRCRSEPDREDPVAVVEKSASRGRRGAVLVTGAASGIGLACAYRLAAVGCTVFAGSRTPDERARLGRVAGITPIPLDVTSESDIAAASAIIVRSLPNEGLIAVVNNAGIMVSGPLEYISVAELRRQFDVNVVGAVALTQAFLPLLRQSEGRIVNIGSTSGRVPSAFAGPYCAAKFALEAITAVWREELHASRISVHAVDPGVVSTSLWAKTAAAERTLSDTLPEEGRSRYGVHLERRQELLRRLGAHGATADAVCDAIVHAVISDNPRRRYTVGLDAKLRVAMARALPEPLRFWLARRRR